jgi:hypothetical protein
MAAQETAMQSDLERKKAIADLLNKLGKSS